MWRNWTLGLAAALLVLAGVYFFKPEAGPIDYNTQVKPIINKNCIACHGGVKREAQFSLLFRNDALSPAESGRRPIIPGDISNSELVRRISSHDPEERMPYKKDPLTREEINILTRWIEQGAKWGDHWAYLPVKQQNPPPASDWTRNDVDRFILDKISTNELTPSAEAPPAKLLRRVSLDIIGMPADDAVRKTYLRSADDTAYEALVDSLLASPHFGERWAAVWMDLARYSDTKGYERDYIRSIWRYRDWVIDAFNRDLRYDSFLIQQLAGDLLPNPTDDQYIATAFHRNTMTNDEGGTDNEEFRTAAVIDRVNTTWEALMGTTFGCVQCHSHPYDPFRHEEYYKFMAFFNDSRDEDTYEDYPLLRHLDSVDQHKLTEITQWIEHRTSPARAQSAELFVKTWQPAINSLQADKMVNAALADTKWLIFRNKAQARLQRVDLTNRNRLIFRFRGYKPGGVWTIRADNLNGPVVAKVNVKVNKDWTVDEVAIKPMQGAHDLWFTYTNPNLKANDSGMMFDWFYFTDDEIPWGKSPFRGEFWKLLTKELPSTPIMMENPREMHRATQVFKRGNWLVKADTVTAGVPSSMPPMRDGVPANRLGLAAWMTDPGHPLVARTIVNRVWEQLFGVGLVETLEDFGTQGATPTHMELLDHLSWQLVHEFDWSLKKLIREMVSSSTYRQDSRVTEEHLAKDPLNRLYARAPRVRLSAEQMRDETLAVAGLLSNKMYGPGVMPYQPDGIWLSPYNGLKWTKSEGEDQYRRAVYTYWKRTAPYPSMMTFDGSAREVCLARRIRTNTPLQALVTLNDSVYVEAAQHLARRMKLGSADLRNQIESGYELALGVKPSGAKLDVLMKLYQTASARTMAKTVSNVAEDEVEDKAMVLVANTILNLDEFITKN